MTKKIYLVSFLDLFAVGLLFPVLSPHIRTFGVSKLSLGILNATYSALQVLSGPIIGSWSDIRGRRSVFLIMLFICIILYFLLGFCGSVYSIFIIRLLLGVVKHTQTLCKAILGDISKKVHDTKTLGRAAAYGTSGFVIGPLIGGSFFSSNNGFTYICLLMSSLFIINFGLVYTLPESKKLQPTKEVHVWKQLKEELSKSMVEISKVNWDVHWTSFVLTFIYIFLTTIFFTNQSLYLKEKYDLPPIYAGYVISYVSIIGVFASYFSSNIVNKFYLKDINCTKRLFHLFIIFSFSFVFIYFCTNYYLLSVILLPFGVSSAMIRVVLYEIIFKNSGDERGLVSGVVDSVTALGRFSAPLFAGIVGHIFNENVVMFYAIIPSIIAVVISCRLDNVNNNKTL